MARRSCTSSGFVRGKGNFVITEYVPTDERTGPRFPLLLTTGRILSQYNVGAQTRRTDNVVWHPEDLLEIHPHDAEQRGVRDGDWVRLASRCRRDDPARTVTERVAPGVVYTTFHHPATQANVVTTDYLRLGDELSGIQGDRGAGLAVQRAERLAGELSRTDHRQPAHRDGDVTERKHASRPQGERPASKARRVRGGAARTCRGARPSPGAFRRARVKSAAGFRSYCGRRRFTSPPARTVSRTAWHGDAATDGLRTVPEEITGRALPTIAPRTRSCWRRRADLEVSPSGPQFSQGRILLAAVITPVTGWKSVVPTPAPVVVEVRVDRIRLGKNPRIVPEDIPAGGLPYEVIDLSPDGGKYAGSERITFQHHGRDIVNLRLQVQVRRH